MMILMEVREKNQRGISFTFSECDPPPYSGKDGRVELGEVACTSVTPTLPLTPAPSLILSALNASTPPTSVKKKVVSDLFDTGLGEDTHLHTPSVPM